MAAHRPAIPPFLAPAHVHRIHTAVGGALGVGLLPEGIRVAQAATKADVAVQFGGGAVGGGDGQQSVGIYRHAAACDHPVCHRGMDTRY